MDLWGMYEAQTMVNAMVRVVFVIVMIGIVWFISIFKSEKKYQEKCKAKNTKYEFEASISSVLFVVYIIVAIVLMFFYIGFNLINVSRSNVNSHVVSILRDDYRKAISSMDDVKIYNNVDDPFLWKEMHKNTESEVLKNTIEICFNKIANSEHQNIEDKPTMLGCFKETERKIYKQVVSQGFNTGL